MISKETINLLEENNIDWKDMTQEEIINLVHVIKECKKREGKR